MNKKYRIKWDSVIVSALIIGIVVVLIVLLNHISKLEEEHIERVSEKCAKEGYGITAQYTKQGDKYYVCKVGE